MARKVQCTVELQAFVKRVCLCLLDAKLGSSVGDLEAEDLGLILDRDALGSRDVVGDFDGVCLVVHQQDVKLGWVGDVLWEDIAGQRRRSREPPWVCYLTNFLRPLGIMCLVFLFDP